SDGWVSGGVCAIARFDRSASEIHSIFSIGHLRLPDKGPIGMRQEKVDKLHQRAVLIMTVGSAEGVHTSTRNSRAVSVPIVHCPRRGNQRGDGSRGSRLPRLPRSV